MCAGDYSHELQPIEYKETEELYMFHAAEGMRYFLALLPLYCPFVVYMYWAHKKCLSYIPVEASIEWRLAEGKAKEAEAKAEEEVA